MWPAPFYLQLAEYSWMSKGKKALPGANPIPQGAGPIQKRECRPAEDSSTCHRKETRETLAMDNSIFPELGTQQVLLHNGRILFCFITKNIFQNIRELESFMEILQTMGNGLSPEENTGGSGYPGHPFLVQGQSITCQYQRTAGVHYPPTSAKGKHSWPASREWL